MKLDARIPVARAMGFKVEFVPPATVRVRVPFAPNVNDKQTVFAGSMYSALVLAPWYLLDHLLRRDFPGVQIAVYQAEIRYLAPVTADFVATATLDEYADLPDRLRSQKTLKVSLTSQAVSSASDLLASFRGKYFISRTTR